MLLRYLLGANDIGRGTASGLSTSDAWSLTWGGRSISWRQSEAAAPDGSHGTVSRFDAFACRKVERTVKDFPDGPIGIASELLDHLLFDKGSLTNQQEHHRRSQAFDGNEREHSGHPAGGGQ